MEDSATIAIPQSRQQTRMRLFWFIAGAGVNYLLISTPFKWLEAHTHLPMAFKTGASLALSTTVFFFWNYFVNFRTDSRKRDALARYIVAVAVMWALSSTVLTLLKHYNFRMSFSLGHFPLDLDIVATQFFLAGIKFLLYHKWAFPVKTTKLREEE